MLRDPRHSRSNRDPESIWRKVSLCLVGIQPRSTGRNKKLSGGPETISMGSSQKE